MEDKNKNLPEGLLDVLQPLKRPRWWLQNGPSLAFKMLKLSGTIGALLVLLYFWRTAYVANVTLESIPLVVLGIVWVGIVFTTWLVLVFIFPPILWRLANGIDRKIISTPNQDQAQLAVATMADSPLSTQTQPRFRDSLRAVRAWLNEQRVLTIIVFSHYVLAAIIALEVWADMHVDVVLTPLALLLPVIALVQLEYARLLPIGRPGALRAVFDSGLVFKCMAVLASLMSFLFVEQAYLIDWQTLALVTFVYPWVYGIYMQSLAIKHEDRHRDARRWMSATLITIAVVVFVFGGRILDGAFSRLGIANVKDVVLQVDEVGARLLSGSGIKLTSIPPLPTDTGKQNAVLYRTEGIDVVWRLGEYVVKKADDVRAARPCRHTISSKAEETVNCIIIPTTHVKGPMLDGK